MFKYFITALLLPVLCNPVQAQVQDAVFVLNGTANTDTGIARLIPEGRGQYNLHKLPIYETKIKDGHFVFKDSLDYPYCFKIIIEAQPEYVSDYFFIEPGIQAIRCNIDSFRAVPAIANASMQEYMQSFKKAEEPIDHKAAELDKHYDSIRHKYDKVPSELYYAYLNERDQVAYERRKLLFNYVKAHPGSYVALWQLVVQLKRGYSSILDSIYQQFGNEIKNTYPARVLSTTLSNARKTAPGSYFPQMVLPDTNNTAKALYPFNKYKYTFIDFWFSHCNPCISQFGELKEIFATYKTKGLNMIGISIDDIKNRENWKAAIKKYQLPWTHYIDVGGKEAGQLSISAYPSNFLLNEKGEIVKTNLEPVQLYYFLKENL